MMSYTLPIVLRGTSKYDRLSFGTGAACQGTFGFSKLAV